MASAQAPWAVTAMVSSPAARAKLAQDWMDDEWGERAALTLEALPESMSPAEVLRYPILLLQQEAARRFELNERDAFWLVSVLEFDPETPDRVPPALYGS